MQVAAQYLKLEARLQLACCTRPLDNMPVHLPSSTVLLDGYTAPPLPILSGVRTSVRNSAQRAHSARPDSARDLSDLSLLLAFARCLGAYTQTNDVVLLRLQSGPAQLARVRWDEGQHWDDVLDATVLCPVAADELEGKAWPCVRSSPAASAGASPLELVLLPHALSLSASSVFFNDFTTAVLLRQAVAIAEHAAAHPSTSVHDLSFLPTDLQSRYDHRLEERRYEHIEPPRVVTELTSRIAVSAPNRVAVQFFPSLASSGLECESLTYADLDRQSNQFAHYLLSTGLQKGDRVSVCLQRSLSFYVCLLGVLKCGACYVPVRRYVP